MKTALYVLVRCTFADACWRKTKMPVVAPAAMLFTSWFEERLNIWSEAESVEAAMVLWSIWNTKNDVVWNDKLPMVDEAIQNGGSTAGHGFAIPQTPKNPEIILVSLPSLRARDLETHHRRHRQCSKIPSSFFSVIAIWWSVVMVVFVVGLSPELGGRDLHKRMRLVRKKF
uniref:Uncharacterized protein n=1 Tax=Cannabis sativa TaxID=3483 RepID=A0A803PVH4_CANSA